MRMTLTLSTCMFDLCWKMKSSLFKGHLTTVQTKRQCNFVLRNLFHWVCDAFRSSESIIICINNNWSLPYGSLFRSFFDFFHVIILLLVIKVALLEMFKICSVGANVCELCAFLSLFYWSEFDFRGVGGCGWLSIFIFIFLAVCPLIFFLATRVQENTFFWMELILNSLLLSLSHYIK